MERMLRPEDWEAEVEWKEGIQRHFGKEAFRGSLERRQRKGEKCQEAEGLGDRGRMKGWKGCRDWSAGSQRRM
jgi:hypothetical protein